MSVLALAVGTFWRSAAPLADAPNEALQLSLSVRQSHSLEDRP
jgi:hypothetical protein